MVPITLDKRHNDIEDHKEDLTRYCSVYSFANRASSTQ